MTVIKFGTDGWRDLMYDRFNLPNVCRVVRAIAKYTKEHQGAERGLVIGYDARFFSDLFAKKAAQIAAAAGIKVFLGSRDFPTPVIAHAVKQHGAFGAMMFTASHNPPEYNGIKFIPEYAGPASLEITREIENCLESLPESAAADAAMGTGPLASDPRIQVIDPTSDYLKQLGELVDVQAIREAGLRVVVDPMFATGRGFIPGLLSGCPVEEIHGWRDPLFGGFMPDPQDQFLAELKAKVSAGPHAIGLATDGDADRFGIIDCDGTYLTPNQVIPLLMLHLIRSRGYRGVAARSVATTHMIDRLGEVYGVETIETPVGFKYIGELMRTRPVIIGGEESGGLSVRGHIPEKDGILAGALMAEMVAVTRQPLHATLRQLYEQVGHFLTRRLDLHLTEEAKGTILERCRTAPPERIDALAVREVRTRDGFKFVLEDGSWFLIRPSGTEALIRVYFEAGSAQALDNLSGSVGLLLEQWGKRVG
ncbi:phosphomannomutase [Hydrogenispora ethanolica]|uniref:Phosphoglucomutase n=1 Tax=Hydrogenispora ethanolica TaxID=1082276 RepID=A0A4R1SA24_HYDET|nr:phosphoglucomutase/phosphomannomutase family protein [Hydrogenispora ethanolica]TCL76353.1 phosphomannomutase [Hydrogenispora ethanolica]